MIQVPTAYQLYVNNAANQLGISPDIVAAQIETESNWDPNALSAAGAEGIAQFEPGTWNQYGSGSPYNVSDAFAAYTKYMGTLLKQYNGNVREALAAYNAGSGNLSAGYGYADNILEKAGAGSSVSSSGVATATQAVSLSDFWPTGITKFFDLISSGIFWLRVLMFVAGSILLTISILNLIGVTKKAVAAGKDAAKVAVFA